MSRFKIIRRDLPYKEIIVKSFTFIAIVSLIVYFLPRDGKFNYHFSINKPWKYGQLMATFDFPIYKDDAVVEKEQDSILAHFQPYYTLNNDVEKESIAKLRASYNTSLHEVLPSTDYIRYIEQTLREIYKSGVVSVDDLNRLYRDSTKFIVVVDDKEGNPRITDGIFTSKEAYEYILSSNTTYKKEILRQCSLNEYINPNLTYDEARSEMAKADLIDNYPYAIGLVQSGQKIVDRGEIIDAQTFRILESLRKESVKRSESNIQKSLILTGQTGFIGVFVLCLMLYLQLFRKEYFNHIRGLSLLFTLIVFYCLITALMVGNNFFNVYIVPYAMLPVIIRIFIDSRTAFLAHTVTILICSVVLRFPYEFIILQIPAGLVAIFSLRELSQRSQLFRTAFLVLLTYTVVYLSYELIIENDLSKLNTGMYKCFAVNGILLLFTYPLLFLLEKTFGFTSNVTLVELSDINHPLLRRMSETAPGTFQHSMQVANLAAEAAVHVGAKSQLVRTGALYHDIGKMENPAFFTENQLGGVNPHKKLSYEESAQIVIDHVRNGLKLADKNNLPQAIKDFISTHHGRGKTKYFYISWKNEHAGEEPDDELFTYPGPNPFSKETAILMMADSVEAASRSLSEYTEESISRLVDRIIDVQVAEGYFKGCPITFQDIATIKEVFKNKLMTSYHTRISYPELKTPVSRRKRGGALSGHIGSTS